MKFPFLPLLLSLLLLPAVAAPAGAEVINVEFNFTPFTGDPDKSDVVEAVAGRALVILNGIPLAEQEIDAKELPVLFDEREVAAAVWIPTESLGALLRKGQNRIRIEFTPADAKQKYRARLRWASVNDESTESTEGNRTTSTNMSDSGTDDKAAAGPVVMERSFVADFAADRPWHHYPPVTELTEAERTAVAGLVQARVDAFRPDFEALYALLEGSADAGEIDLSAVRESGCLARAWEAGIRLAAPPADKLQVVTTGHAAVVVQSPDGQLFFPADPAAFEKISDESDQMCIGAILGRVYQPRLIVVRTPKGAWEVVN